MKSIACLLLLILSLNGIGQDQNDRPVRDSFTLIMPVSKESYYESPIQSTPFVVGPNILQLFPGDTVFVEIEQKNGIITGLKPVKTNRNNDKTVEISFVQNVEEGKHLNMVLKVKNPFKKNLSYEAVMRVMNSQRWAPTSIIPVKAGLIGIEMWPDVIVSIALTEWKLL